MEVSKIEFCENSSKLRELILQRPELPIVVLTDYEVVGEGYGWWYGCDIRFSIDKLILVNKYGEDTTIDDSGDFEEYIQNELADMDEYKDLSYEDLGLTPDQIQEIDKLYKEKCELVAFKDSIMEAYIKVIDTAVALTYELLNEIDVNGLEYMSHIDLAYKWTELIENGVLDEDELKGRLKAYFIEKARGQQLNNMQQS